MRQFIKAGKRLDKPPAMPDDIFSLVVLCWDTDPAKRPPFAWLRDRIHSACKGVSSINVPFSDYSSSVRTRRASSIDGTDSLTSGAPRRKTFFDRLFTDSSAELSTSAASTIKRKGKLADEASRKSSLLSVKPNNTSNSNNEHSSNGSSGVNGSPLMARSISAESPALQRAAPSASRGSNDVNAGDENDVFGEDNTPHLYVDLRSSSPVEEGGGGGAGAGGGGGKGEGRGKEKAGGDGDEADDDNDNEEDASRRLNPMQVPYITEESVDGSSPAKSQRGSMISPVINTQTKKEMHIYHYLLTADFVGKLFIRKWKVCEQLEQAFHQR